MSNISTIRSLIADSLLYDRAEATGDGVTTEFHVPQFPIYPDSETVLVNGTAQSKDSPADYIIDDSVGLITFSTAPGDGLTVTITHKHSILTDIQLQEFLDLEDDDIKLAAADAIDAIASNQVLVQKVIKVLDLQTDGAKVAEAMHKLAQDYRKQVLDADLQGSEFDYAEQINDAPGLREKILKDWLREGL
jgi:hypothetical protein